MVEFSVAVTYLMMQLNKIYVHILIRLFILEKIERI